MKRFTCALLAGIFTAIAQPSWSQAPAPERPLFETKKVDGMDNAYVFRYGNARDFLTFLQESSAAVEVAARKGTCWDTAEKEVKMPSYASWPNYDAAWPLVVRRYCGLWGRGT